MAGCVFCDVIVGATPAHIVRRTDAAVCFLDARPVFKGHVLVVPTEHVVTLPDLAPAQLTPFFEQVQSVSRLLPPALEAQGSFVAMNNVVSQSVAHLHCHVVPRTKGDGLRGFFWPRTKYADGEAEVYAAKLREALA